MVPGQRHRYGHPEKVCRLCPLSGQAHQQGTSGRVQHGDLPAGSTGRTAETRLPAAAYRGAGVLCVPAHLLGPYRQGDGLRSPDALRYGSAALARYHHEAGAGAGRTVRDRAADLLQIAGELRPPAQRGPCAQGHDAVHQLHCKRLPAQRGQRVYGEPLA